MLLRSLLLTAFAVLARAIPKGGGAGRGGSSSGGSSGGSSGSRYYGGHYGSGRGGVTSVVIFAIVFGGIGMILLFCLGRCWWQHHKRKRTRIANPTTGEETQELGQLSDTSYGDFQRGLAFCNANPVSHDYPVVSGLFEFEGCSPDMAGLNQVLMERDEHGLLLTSNISSGLQKTVLSNYPLNQSKECHGYEFVIESLPAGSIVAIGLAAKPYPDFRFPGWHRESVGLHSDDGRKFFDNSYGGVEYSKPLKEGDVVCLSYIRSTGSIFYSVNGHKLPDAYTNKFDGLKLPVYVAVGFEGPSKLRLKDPAAPDTQSIIPEPESSGFLKFPVPFT